MPNGREQVTIQLGGKSYTLDAPAGLSDQQVVSLAVAHDPEFAMAYSQRQASQESTSGLRQAGQRLKDYMGYARMGEEEETARGAPPALAGELAVASAPRLPGAALGGAGGTYLGKEIGSAWSPEASQWGGRIGGIVGSLAGGVINPRTVMGHMPLGRYGLLSRIMGGIRGAEGAAASSGEAEIGKTLADRVRAEGEAERVVRTPEEFRSMEQAGRARESATGLQKPRARLRGMIYAGRGEPPRPTNEEIGLGGSGLNDEYPKITSKTLVGLPEETAEEAARRRFLSAQIRRGGQQ